MGYTTHADSDLIGMGVSAISHIGDTYSQNASDLASWKTAIDDGHLPVFRGIKLSDDEMLRSNRIQQLMYQSEIPIDVLERRYAIDFDRYFAEALERMQPLFEEGLVQRAPDRIVVTKQGRLLLCNIAMCFDLNPA